MSIRELTGALAFLLLLPLSGQADIPLGERVTIDGDIRYRLEVEDRDFDSNTGMNEYSYLRTLLGFTVEASEEVMLRIKFKDSRFLGTSGSNKKSSSFFDLQEGYILTRKFLGLPLNLQLGRYEILYGRRRILGNGIWNNFGPRTYDGFRLFYRNEAMKWDFFYAKIVERGFTDQKPYTNDDFSKQDWNKFALVGSLLDGSVQPLVMFDWDACKTATVNHPDYYATPGVYYTSNISGMKVDLDAAIQYGKKADRDLISWLLAMDVSSAWDHPFKPKIGLGADISSGVSNTDFYKNKKDHTFYAPFMSRHTFRGYMDYFQDVQKGMIDTILRLGAEPFKDWKFSSDIHNFRSINSLKSDKQKDFYQYGQEVDLRLMTKLAKGLELDTAICGFLPSEDWEPNGDPSFFFYCTFTGKF